MIQALEAPENLTMVPKIYKKIGVEECTPRGNDRQNVRYKASHSMEERRMRVSGQLSSNLMLNAAF